MLWDQVINQASTGALSAIAFVTLSWRLGRAGQSAVALAMLTAIVLLVPLLYRRVRRLGLLGDGERPASFEPGDERWSRLVAAGGREAIQTLQRLLFDRALVAKGVAATTLYISFNLAAAWAAFAALGAYPPASWVFYAVSLGITIGAISGTPGGGLTTEAAMVTCYTLLGAEASTALAATLLYRGMHYLLVLLYGIPSLLVLEGMHRRETGGERLGSHSDPSES